MDGQVQDLAAPLSDGAAIEILTPGSDADALWLIRHDAAHVMATAVLDLWPGTKVSIGPPIADGFYYDFEFPDGFRPSDSDLERIEERMRAHVEADERFERSELPAAEAIERFRAEHQPYKVELIEDLVRDAGGRDGLAVPQRLLRRPLPRAPRALDRPDRRLQAELGGRRLLARRRDPPDAHPNLRHRLLLEAGARASIWSGSRRRGPATTAGSARSSASSRSAPRRPGCRSGCRREPSCCD